MVIGQASPVLHTHTQLCTKTSLIPGVGFRKLISKLPCFFFLCFVSGSRFRFWIWFIYFLYLKFLLDYVDLIVFFFWLIVMFFLHALAVNTSEKMWENFKLGKISENRNKNVKCNAVTYPLKLPCQWSFVTHSLFPIILLFALQVLHQTRTRTSHVARTREDTILSFLWNCFSWLLHYICRKTRKFFFMTIAYAHRT